MSKTIKYQTLKQIAEDVRGTARPFYSGRFMFGQDCVGIVLDSNYIQDLGVAIRDAGASKILTKSAGYREDTMGKSVIVYWEQVKCVDAPEEEF